jgi:glycosyltransferase involved in cell wall biosynthesis
MKVAIWLSDDMIPTKGGGASYYKTLINGIDNYSFDPSIEIVYVTYRNDKRNNNLNRQIIELYPNVFMMLLFEIPRRFFDFIESISWKDKMEFLRNKYYINQKLKKQNVDIIYYIQPTCKIQDFPFIVQNWDLSFHSMYSFPEVINNYAFKVWNRFYTHYLKKAFCVFSESEAGKEELVRYLNIEPQKIHVIPIFPNASLLNANADLKVLEKFNLAKDNFFFYPAQFWAHKNHYNLLRAFQKLKNIAPSFKLVFTGSDKGNLKYIKELITEFDLDDDVKITGFVSENQLKALYENAAALVMPTFLGPTNMPLLEAYSLGCKVICSDFKGHREQLGEDALYFQPNDYNDILGKMCEIVEKDTSSLKIGDSARSNYFTLENALFQINKNLLEISNIKMCWKA